MSPDTPGMIFLRPLPVGIGMREPRNSAREHDLGGEWRAIATEARAGFCGIEVGSEEQGEESAASGGGAAGRDEAFSDLALAAEGWVADNADRAVKAVRCRRCQDEVDQCVERKSAALDVGAVDGCARRLARLRHTAG